MQTHSPPHGDPYTPNPPKLKTHQIGIFKHLFFWPAGDLLTNRSDPHSPQGVVVWQGYSVQPRILISASVTSPDAVTRFGCGGDYLIAHFYHLNHQVSPAHRHKTVARGGNLHPPPQLEPLRDWATLRGDGGTHSSDARCRGRKGVRTCFVAVEEAEDRIRGFATAILSISYV
ncbi:hypothetical protein FA13DRAFT_1723542 [Coprinellus micaceus]|uniref:Uncharacterized protein n=1 Tax=Coprinellus micaceus TaxID=71717 RepID=A0A4Y7R5C6_COPMI|nr:hypothetical protein FA13DRAFT_1723542 [Coprinellus micaceus]